MDTSPLTTLLVHDGELADVRGVLCDLMLPFVESDGSRNDPIPGDSFDLLVGTPRRMLELLRQPRPPRAAVRIAMLSGKARTLRSVMKRENVEYVVRRPVHPAALRLLILHALYRGPEKRTERRVTLGVGVRFRHGWRLFRGILADLSTTGCRMLSSHPVPRGDVVRFRLPTSITGQGRLTLCGRVTRCVPVGHHEPGLLAIAVRFEALDWEASGRLRATVESYGFGPPVLTRSGRPLVQPLPEAAARGPETDAGDAASGWPHPRAPRRHYPRRVISLGDEVSRVLMGRDLSARGMRIAPHPELGLGDRLQLAIHAGPGDPPLVVEAEVARDDGDAGLALLFQDLSGEAREYLARLVAALPADGTAPVMDAGGALVVSSILDPADADGSVPH